MRRRFTQRIPIRFDDVDYAQVLYYPRQVHYFVVALEHFFADALDLPWKRMFEQERLAMPTVHLEVTYRRPLGYGEQADVSVWVEELGHRRVVFAYEVVNAQSGELTCQARQTVVFVTCPAWQAVPVPEVYRSALAPYIAEAREAGPDEGPGAADR
ncbi:MAG: acyl-CoA thioesterase [Planctomycetota bacterium]|jgi:YbgC/YbaW family acyl-CoA thioester hydrolase